MTGSSTVEAGQDDRKSGDNGFMQENVFPRIFLFFGRLGCVLNGLALVGVSGILYAGAYL